MSEENKALMLRWFDEVWNQNRVETIDELFAADGVGHGLSDDKPINGPADFKPFQAAFRGAFPDIEVVVKDLIAEGDKVVARCAVRGRHTGDHLGMAASNAGVDFGGVVIARIENGKIAEAWNYFDFLKMNRQIGVI